MKKLRIFELLSAIEPIELKRFHRYIKSDSVYASRDYLPLVEHLMEYYPEFRNEKLTLESMYGSLYPGKKFNNRVIISRISELNRMVENFLLSMKLNKNHALRSKLVAEMLMDRRAFTNFDNLLGKMINIEKNVKKISERQLYDLDLMLMLKGQSLLDREMFVETHELLEENIEVFLIYVVTRILTMYCAIKNIENFQIAGNSILQLESYMKNIDLENLVKSLGHNKLSAYMKVMVQVYRLYDSKTNDQLYFKAKKELLENIDVFEQISKFTIFSFLYSYAVQQINMRRVEFNAEIYDILKLIIKHRAYMKAENEYMPSMLFREFVITALKQKDTRGAERFIADYAETLAPENRKTLREYSSGKIMMHQKKYSGALMHYAGTPGNIQILNLDMKIDRLVCLYELGNFDKFREDISKNKTLLKNNKHITEFQRSSFKAYIEIMERLIGLRLKPDKKAKLKLIKDTEKKKILHYKEWILQQSANLK
ncbi:MAG TPA: hypothetical protein PK753_14130 [Ignavibacteria bacterium]|nr:hypothetical protein [Ignavibacteria bacterium]